MIREITRLSATAGLFAVLVAGCSASKDSTSSPDPAAVDRASSALDEANALAAQVEEASGRLIRMCMEDAGFTVHPVDDAGTAPAEESSPFVDPPTPEQVEVGKGYPADPEPSESAPQAKEDSFERLPEEEKQRYAASLGTDVTIRLDDGTELPVPVDGCGGKVAGDLFGDVQAAVRNAALARRGRDVARRDTENDATVVAALRGWSACMEKAGFPGLAEPADARDLSRREKNGGPPVDVLPLARADASCGAESRVAQTRNEVWKRNLGSYIASHEADVLAYRDSQRKALENAQRLLQR